MGVDVDGGVPLAGAGAGAGAIVDPQLSIASCQSLMINRQLSVTPPPVGRSL